MLLIDHLKATGKTVVEFANELQEAEGTIRKIVYQQRQPSLTLAVKISSATGGAVTEAELLKPPAKAA